jgi:hypothetical protein
MGAIHGDFVSACNRKRQKSENDAFEAWPHVHYCPHFVYLLDVTSAIRCFDNYGFAL